MAKVIGLTGGFGTGKTLVASVFKALGGAVLDADAIAHEALGRSSSVYAKVVRAFGSDISAGGEIDRKRLAGIVFNDPRALSRLNRLVHPYVLAKIGAAIKKAGRHDVVVIDAPLLIEAGLAGSADILVVVTCSRAEQIARCVKKFRMRRSDVLRRLANQIPVGRKAAMADFVIDNSKTKAQTKRQAEKVWKEIVWK